MKAFLMVPRQPGLGERHVPLRFVQRAGGSWALVDQKGWPLDGGYVQGLADVLEARITTDDVPTVNAALGLPEGNDMVVAMKRTEAQCVTSKPARGESSTRSLRSRHGRPAPKSFT